MSPRLRSRPRQFEHARVSAPLACALLALAVVAGVGLGRSLSVVAPTTASKPVRALSAPYFGNCAEARAAGAAPIYAGQPGYRSELDADRDGVACEPYYGN